METVRLPRETPLSRALDDNAGARRATPLDLLQLARDKFLNGERLDLGRLAQELGVARVTVFRWAGTRENLYGEVCSALFQKELERATRHAKGRGLPSLLDTLDRLLRSLAEAAPLRKFVAEESEFALRVLTSKASPVQYRCTVAIQERIAALVEAKAMQPALPPDELAYIIVRITESFLYRDVLTGGAADIGTAIRAIRILLTASDRTVVEWSPNPSHVPARRRRSASPPSRASERSPRRRSRARSRD